MLAHAARRRRARQRPRRARLQLAAADVVLKLARAAAQPLALHLLIGNAACAPRPG